MVSVDSSYSFDDFLKIMRRLRAPDGCPWDRVQTHESIKNNMVEESYEVVDAIEKNDFTALREELGDVLMQVVFHSQLAEDENEFTFDDVVNEVSKKLVFRHPHVFSETDGEIKNPEQVLEKWDELKRIEKKQETFLSTLESVPNSFPALMRAQKVQKRAAKAGFDWDDILAPLEKIYEETEELKTAIKENNQEHIFEEFGDLLFSAVNVSRFLKIDSEDALRKATDKFINRFSKVEKAVSEKGLKMDELSLEELDKFWEKAK